MLVITLNGGLRAGVGLFSIFDALRLARAGAATIDVDKSCFQTLIYSLVGLTVASGNIALRVKTVALAFSISFVVMIVIGTFIDGRFSPAVIEALMTSKGYQRCTQGDHVVRGFRSATYFSNYASNAANCHSKRL